ncbi:hypothetical protein QZH41_004446 [Actinostola sp. cb2023]|nr:hypothetical protein QZH41_004446 [Actinostola sp. cb2023]
MKWKKQSRVETATSRASTNSVKVSTIAVHELYEQDELDQEWQEVYVTSAYLVWCPSNKKRRKKRESSSKSSSASSTKHHYKVIPKDVTEDFVPASLEITKPCRPKSTKTPTGGQPFSPHRPTPNPRLTQYGSNEVSPIDEPKSELPKISTKEPDNTKEILHWSHSVSY